MKDTDNISIKSRSINYNSEKKLGQKNLEAKFEVRLIFEARPKFGLRPGQLWGQGRPGQVLYSMPRITNPFGTQKIVSLDFDEGNFQISKLVTLNL